MVLLLPEHGLLCVFLQGKYGCRRFLRDGYQTVKEVGLSVGSRAYCTGAVLMLSCSCV